MFIFGFFSPYKYSRARAICTYSSRTKLYRAPLIKSYFLFLINACGGGALKTSVYGY